MTIANLPKSIREQLQNQEFAAFPFVFGSYPLVHAGDTKGDFFDLASLAVYLGTSPELLKALHNVASTSLYYTFYIDKDTNKIVPYTVGLNLREINSPCQLVKDWQLRLIEWFSQFPVHKCNFAFLQGSSIKLAAETVKDGDVLIHADIKDFFSNHSTLYVHDRLRKLMETAGLLVNQVNVQENLLSTLCRIVMCGTKLPQGSPCSPILTCILNYEMDVKIQALADEFHLNYMRYADDLCFSGNVKDVEALDFIDRLEEVINPFTLNYKKLNIMRDTEYPIFTGIKVRYPKSSYVSSAQAGNIVKMVMKKFGFDAATTKVQVSRGLILIKPKIDSPIPFDTLNETIKELSETLGNKYKNVVAVVKPDFYYIKSNKKVLGLTVNNGTVTYPRAKYIELRMQSMLMGIQRAIHRYKNWISQIVKDRSDTGNRRFDHSYDLEFTFHMGLWLKNIGTPTYPSLKTKPVRNLYTHPFNRKVYTGKLSYLRMIDPGKADKLVAIEKRAFKRMVQRIHSHIMSAYSSRINDPIYDTVRRDAENANDTIQ